MGDYRMKYIAIIIGDKDMNQIAAQYDISAIWAKKMAGALADALEDSLAALWSSISTNTIGDTATVVTDSEIRQAINKLDSTNYDLTECAFENRAHNKPSYMLENLVRSFILMPTMA